MEIKNKEKKNWILWAGIILFQILYGMLLTYLHYQQTLYAKTGTFESDLFLHISMAVDDNWFYSLTAFIYGVLYRLPYGNFWIGLFLALCHLLAIYGTYLLLKELWKKYDIQLGAEISYLLAIGLNFVMAFYVKSVNATHYVGYQNANIWHNSTYICMKLVAIFVLWYFLKLMESYKERLTVRQWITFSLLLVISTGVKPNFLLVFAPVMAIMLLVDLFHKVKFLKIFAFGMTVVPSLFVVLWQNLVLFGEDTGNGFLIKPFYTLAQRSDNPKIALLFSVLFPAVVGIFHIKDVFKDKIYMGSLMIWAMGFLEVFFFVESGNRSKDANFMWGYSISLFALFVISLVRLVRDYKNKEFLQGKKVVRYGYLFVATSCFLYHIVSGLWFFGILLTGATYFS